MYTARVSVCEKEDELASTDFDRQLLLHRAEEKPAGRTIDQFDSASLRSRRGFCELHDIVRIDISRLLSGQRRQFDHCWSGLYLRPEILDHATHTSIHTLGAAVLHPFVHTCIADAFQIVDLCELPIIVHEYFHHCSHVLAGENQKSGECLIWFSLLATNS
jgi:hypothetical protein